MSRSRSRRRQKWNKRHGLDGRPVFLQRFIAAKDRKGIGRTMPRPSLEA